jgi:hypothetical protein
MKSNEHADTPLHARTLVVQRLQHIFLYMRADRAPLLIAFLASCESVRITSPCEDRAPNGEHVVVMESRITRFDQLRVGDTVTLRASVHPVVGYGLNTSFGNCFPITGDPVPATIAWSSHDVATVTVTAGGIVQARRAGATEVVARDAARNIEEEWEFSVLP